MNRILPVIFLALLGCEEKHDTESTSPYCEDVETIITLDDETAIGVTGGDLIDGLPETSSADIAWSGGESTALIWGFAADTDTLRFVESTAVYPEPEPGQEVPSIGVECSDYVAVDGILNLQSEDGQLNEALSLTITIDEYGASELFAAFFVELDVDTLEGSLILSDYLNESDYDTVRLFLSGEITGGILSGELHAQGEGSSGDAVFAESITIATFDGE